MAVVLAHMAAIFGVSTYGTHCLQSTWFQIDLHSKTRCHALTMCQLRMSQNGDMMKSLAERWGATAGLDLDLHC
jgi:hypothetical protein